MNIRTLAVAALLLATTVAIQGCGGSYNDPAPSEPPPPPPPVAFSQFVKDQFANTADDTDPVDVDAMEFSFTDQDNPDAFDDLLTAP
ncbi:MAG: hypothetical protein ACREQ8_05370 [Woeseiaceae bacterium]